MLVLALPFVGRVAGGSLRLTRMQHSPRRLALRAPLVPPNALFDVLLLLLARELEESPITLLRRSQL